MPKEIKAFKAGTGLITGATLNDILAAIRERTPLAGEGVTINEEGGGMRIHADESAAGDAYIHPFKVSSTNNYVNPGVATIAQADYEVILSGIPGSGDGDIYFKVNGTTTDGYFTADSIELDHDSIMPGDTDTAKYFKIAEVDAGQVIQMRKSDFFFRDDPIAVKLAACPETYGGGFGGLGFSATHTAALNDFWDPFEPECTRYLYTWAGIRDSVSLTEEAWDDGKGWEGPGNSGYVLTPILYDEDSVANLIARIYTNITDGNDYTIYEVHFFGRQQTLNGTPSSFPEWWTELYYEPTFLKYQPWTWTDVNPDYVPYTLLRGVDRGVVD